MLVYVCYEICVSSVGWRLLSGSVNKLMSSAWLVVQSVEKQLVSLVGARESQAGRVEQRRFSEFFIVIGRLRSDP